MLGSKALGEEMQPGNCPAAQTATPTHSAHAAHMRQRGRSPCGRGCPVQQALPNLLTHGCRLCPPQTKGFCRQSKEEPVEVQVQDAAICD